MNFFLKKNESLFNNPGGGIFLGDNLIKTNVYYET